MMAIPAFMVLFRERIDRWLLPVQKYRQHIPRLVLIGAGMAAPLAVSWFLYGLGGLREYDYLRVSLVAGTAVAYLILRTPRVSSRSPRT